MSEENILLNLFCCYADEDKELCDALDDHLSALKQNTQKYTLDITYSRKFPIGMEREHERAKRLNRADIILLLISSDYMAWSADYLHKEIIPALKRRDTESDHMMRVVPILLRPYLLTDAPFRHLEMLPTDKRAIILWTNRDEALVNVVGGIRIVAEDLVSSSLFLKKKKREKFEESFDEGYLLKDDPPYQRALGMFEGALQADPGHDNAADAYYYKGDVLNKLARYDEALIALQASFDLSPNKAYVYNSKGVALNALGRYDEALKAYEEALHLDPGYAFAYYHRGDTLFQLTRSVTLMLLEIQPRFVVKPEQRQDLLLLGKFNSAVNTASYTSGRIFHIYGELRWERQEKHIQVVYTGDRVYTPALKDSEEMVLEYKPIIRSYFLFGKRLDEGQLKRIGPAAQSGDFAEVRISRLLRYPALPALAGAQYIQLAVCEYSDPITGVNIAYRFKKLIPFQKSQEQEKI